VAAGVPRRQECASARIEMRELPAATAQQHPTMVIIASKISRSNFDPSCLRYCADAVSNVTMRDTTHQSEDGVASVIVLRREVAARVPRHQECASARIEMRELPVATAQQHPFRR